MTDRSKRYRESAKLIAAAKVYPSAEALALLKSMPTVKFDAGVEVHLKLGIDPKQGDQIVRGTVQLPSGSATTKRVAVFADGAAAKEAEAAGADLVGGEDLVKQVKQKGGIDADICVAHPTMMKHLGQVAKILGPKGLMPNPKNETVTPNVGKAVKELKGGRVTFRSDDSGNVHQLIGRVSWEQPKLEANFAAFLDAVRKAKPASSKGSYLQHVSVSTTMGPAVRLSV